MQRTRKPVRARIVALVVALALVGLACKPIPHPNFVVVDDASSVHVLGLSGDGNYVVVTSTAASASVPGPGLWRVDRRDGTAVQLPEGAKFERISDDGQRISYRIEPEPSWGAGLRVWDNGRIVAPPAFTEMSDDLHFGIFLGFFDGVLQRWELATGARTVIDTGGRVPLYPLQISDHGNLAYYQGGDRRGNPPTCDAYHVDLTTMETTMQSCQGDGLNSEYYWVGFDWVWFGDGLGIYCCVGGPSRIQVGSRNQPGTVLLEVSTVGTFFEEIQLVGSPPVLWAADVLAGGTLPPGCGGILGEEPCTFDTETLSVVSASLFDQRRFDVDPGMARLGDHEPMRSSVSEDGRFLAYQDHVLDRAWGTDEDLPEVPGRGDRRGPWFFSDDNRVIVSGPPVAGWYEYLAADA